MNEGSVTYTVKELIGMLEKTLGDQLNGIATRLDTIDRKIDEKATNLRVQEIERRLSQGEERIGALELFAAGNVAVTKFQRWVIGTVGIGMLGSVATLIWLAAGGHP